MKWFKNSIALAGLLMLFAWSTKDNSVFSEDFSTPLQTVRSVETVKVVGTKQTIAEHQFQNFVKENARLLFTFLPFHFEEFKLFLTKKFTSFLSRQDHNRCEKVSKLLFPYHFFW